MEALVRNDSCLFGGGHAAYSQSSTQPAAFAATGGSHIKEEAGPEEAATLMERSELLLGVSHLELPRIDRIMVILRYVSQWNPLI